MTITPRSLVLGAPLDATLLDPATDRPADTPTRLGAGLQLHWNQGVPQRQPEGVQTVVSRDGFCYHVDAPELYRRLHAWEAFTASEAARAEGHPMGPSAMGVMTDPTFEAPVSLR